MSDSITLELSSVVLDVIERHPDGLSEYEFMKFLKTNYNTAQIENAFDNNHSLFKAHFILFHVLYKLRNDLWLEKKGHLDISPLKIQLLPYVEQESGLTEFDELAAYYLDISHLKNTSATEVEQMLSTFYEHLSGWGKRKWALEQLGLEDPVDNATIRITYKRLVMKFHPDRGGDKETVQLINEAVKVLLGKV
ncbi:MAG: DnaJ domain-containing protein [Gammaproteobacteria bacterium]|nr:DnaJ domain-containing protein [Gammaproteobacteria bacterium]MDH5802896.1 DnaJ domain-containing protein [Gammaproteobacteria bacterium]